MDRPKEINEEEDVFFGFVEKRDEDVSIEFRKDGTFYASAIPWPEYDYGFIELNAEQTKQLYEKMKSFYEANKEG